MPDLSPVVPTDRPETSWEAPAWPVDDDEAEGPGLRRHREVLMAAILAMAFAFAMVEVPEGRVAVRGFPDHPLPETCGARSLFGVRCPGCGLTRSFIHLAEGDWRASWRSHRLGWMIAALVAFQIPYRMLAILQPKRSPISTRWTGRIAWAVIALLLANWLVEVVAGRLTSL